MTEKKKCGQGESFGGSNSYVPAATSSQEEKGREKRKNRLRKVKYWQSKDAKIAFGGLQQGIGGEYLGQREHEVPRSLWMINNQDGIFWEGGDGQRPATDAGPKRTSSFARLKGNPRPRKKTGGNGGVREDSW